ncbi:HLA class II histocompatibility antigen, DP alpha 1 chain-like [Myxocyprinus asiaticus]|uniref:HLA class II histocompatibility antigen, DP alpha 1 chain-like n=1 Tax=Myxocyprinus asiaticus TaxID=70543 RepID=UPI0022216670|nr:HLA class II histocompatibility antigen, DP alpha 1 chain-like [Myxocyprinus asiaticus]
MELYVLILTFTVLVSSEVNVVHEDFELIVVSNTPQQEDMIGFDGEEIVHSDFARKQEVYSLPDFSDPMQAPGFYEQSVTNQQILKGNLDICIKAYKNPPQQMDPPQTSIYAENDVVLRVENNLICHVTGFYPPYLNISWTKNNEIVTEASLSQYRPNKDGTYNIFSTLTMTPMEGDIYSCTVNHMSLKDQPQTKTWEVDVALPSVGPAVFCGVGLTLGLLGVAVGTFFLIKGNNCN